MHHAPPRAALWTALALVPALAVLGWPSSADAQVVGAGGMLFFDEGEFVGERRISVQRTSLDADFGNDSMVGGAIWALFEIGDRVRLGPAYRFFGSYDVRLDDADDDDDAVELGWLMEFTAQLDWVLPMTADFDFLLGAQAGVVLLVPSGDLEDRIDELQGQGIDVFGGPRVGYVVGPQVGMKWNINEMFAVRSDFAVRWQQIFLFQTEQRIAGTPFLFEQRLDLVRYEVDLGLEVAF